MLMNCTPNGCTCAAVRESAIAAGEPMPRDWACISCTSRAKATRTGAKCAGCGTGLLSGERSHCTECQWLIEDGG